VRDAGAAVRDGGQHDAGFRVRPPERPPSLVGYAVRPGGGVLRRDGDDAPLRRELDGVLEEVVQYPSDPFRVALEEDGRVLERRGDADLPLRRGRLDLLDRMADERLEPV